MGLWASTCQQAFLGTSRLHSIHGSERPDTRSPGSGDGRAPLQSSVTQDDSGPSRLGVRRPGKGLLAPASMTGQQRWQNAASGQRGGHETLLCMHLGPKPVPGTGWGTLREAPLFAVKTPKELSGPSAGSDWPQGLRYRRQNISKKV